MQTTDIYSPDGNLQYSNTVAYARNKDPDSPKYPMINFCPLFFLRPNLGTAIKTKDSYFAGTALNIDKYINRGSAFLVGCVRRLQDCENMQTDICQQHELFHLNLAANSPNPNPKVWDLTMTLPVEKDANGNPRSGTRDFKIYGGLLTKTLARWKGTTSQSVGYWVQRNSDNLSLYALAKYIMTKNGNVYPHLPMAVVNPTSPPYHAAVYPITQTDSQLYMNISTAYSSMETSDIPMCPAGADDDDDAIYATDSDTSVVIDGFSDNSVYPAEYIAQVQSWLDDANNNANNSNNNNTSSTVGAQQLAIASYTNPLGDPAAWSRLISYDTNKLSVLVANVLNGPDYIVNQAWADVIQRAAASGKTIIGYVRTGYLGVSVQQFKTRLGSGDLADWASQIEQDVDKWFELYPQIGGIFFDEGWPECGPDNVYAELYAYINAYTKRKHPGAFTVLNPGSPMAQCFENTMDTLLTFESFYDYYKNNYVPNDWTPQDSRKIWHIIYNVPQDKVYEVADLARQRGAGLIEITDDTTPNPYDNVPSEAYMQNVFAGVSGGSLHIGHAPDTGGHYISGEPFAKVEKVDYTSATLSWNPVDGALGYGVYRDGSLILELPPTMTRATVGMLEPGTSGIHLEVRTLSMSDITETPISAIVSTTALPADGAITNVHYSQNGDMVTYTADVLVPFAFVRLFISGPQPSFPRYGWPVTLATSEYNQYKIMNYLVEGNDFYSTFFKYTGAYYEGSSTPADWSWNPIDTPGEPTSQSNSGYTYTWTFPADTTDAVLYVWLVQGQGYAPISNVWGGCIQRFDSVGHTHDAC